MSKQFLLQILKHTSSGGSGITTVVGISCDFILNGRELCTVVGMLVFQLPRPVNHNIDQNTLEIFFKHACAKTISDLTGSNVW